MEKQGSGKNYLPIQMNRKAIIFGVKGHYLSNKEKTLLRKFKPWGIILFSRNIKNLNQLRDLVSSIKNIIKDHNYPIIIDQEGGKVSRLNKIIDLSLFSQDHFGKLFLKNKKMFHICYKMYIDKVSEIFQSVGININTVPVLDVRRKFSHSIIGSRSFSKKPKLVKTLGRICEILYQKNRIATVVKHIPGHGLSKKDSHKSQPIISASKLELKKNDFFPFKGSKSLFAMTAHVIYSAYDSVNVVTHSKFAIRKIIRRQIGFKGIIMSDDISMKALKFNLEANALMALKSGCNLALHCNGNIEEMIRLSKVVPKIDKFTQKKTSQFYKFLG
jgi:beta-N-acetylhexosaminidase